MTISERIKSTIVQGYVMTRHPESIRLMRKGIKYEHYRDLKKQWLLDEDIHTVLDIGANVGNFAKLSREVFPDATIYSFEPLHDCFEKLTNSLPDDDNFVPIECGVGSHEEKLEFFRSFHSPSSSFLKMEEFHKEAFPYTNEGQSAEPVEIQVKALDDLLRERELVKNVLTKIDVQGFEMEVIEGAKRTLGQTKAVIIEMSFAELYAGQPLFHDVYEKMYSLGFRFHGCLAQMHHPGTGEVVQTDAIFVNENKGH